MSEVCRWHHPPYRTRSMPLLLLLLLLLVLPLQRPRPNLLVVKGGGLVKVAHVRVAVCDGAKRICIPCTDEAAVDCRVKGEWGGLAGPAQHQAGRDAAPANKKNSLHPHRRELPGPTTPQPAHPPPLQHAHHPPVNSRNSCEISSTRSKCLMADLNWPWMRADAARPRIARRSCTCARVAGRARLVNEKKRKDYASSHRYRL